MSKTNKLSVRFQELIEQVDKVLATKQYKQGGYTSGDYVDHAMYNAWIAKATHLLSVSCGEQSAHYLAFKAAGRAGYSTNHAMLVQMKAVFEAAQEDYDGGYFNSIRSLIQAEVFGNELEQATELLEAGYRSAAAVIAGVVLETTMRQICVDHGLDTGSLNWMNDNLVKAQAYSTLVKKQVTALAAVRNSAAHGKPDEFSDKDVEDMISKVGDFIVAHGS